ncbi:MAG TPA: acyl-CoA dehydrogenase family protein [Paracoccus sp. (in: a-proteobacteria)]|uniref:acyl-CoA dehydrogenase family protein n=1 Tax=Paracoccus sp. TaxID=267 RepID=UPI002C37D187|nr:acyl-CoA dehydrogenase family protein [Paracoccus sp. (in: a-proteobacteria)]HWL55600.1 acyl-CoA dehydrogenase family protein [Paracoccus sp. (in: a-proteobacteria)]
MQNPVRANLHVEAKAPRLDQILASLPALVDRIRAGAAQRDRERILPFEAFDWLRQAGIGTLLVPRERGGPGGKLADYIEVIRQLGEGDSNVAHALRSHFNFAQAIVLRSVDQPDDLAFQRLLSGAIFGGAHTENLTRHPGDIGTTLTRQGDHYRLNGRKHYATGTAFADFASISATDEQGELVFAMIPTDREGVEILDDWDGMGQRLTASGGIVLRDVRVEVEEIGQRDINSFIGRHTSTMRQLHLAASAAGAVAAALHDGRDYVLNHGRAATHSHADFARDDFFVQKVLGDIAALSYGVDAAIREAAREQEAVADAILSRASDEQVERLLVQASINGARAQLVSGQLALEAAGRIFELGGGSATSQRFNLDRHWRNIRTVLNHNPLNHKARVIGDYLLNGTTTHLLEGKVF